MDDGGANPRQYCSGLFRHLINTCPTKRTLWRRRPTAHRCPPRRSRRNGARSARRPARVGRAQGGHPTLERTRPAGDTAPEGHPAAGRGGCGRLVGHARRCGALPQLGTEYRARAVEAASSILRCGLRATSTTIAVPIDMPAPRRIPRPVSATERALAASIVCAPTARRRGAWAGLPTKWSTKQKRAVTRSGVARLSLKIEDFSLVPCPDSTRGVWFTHASPAWPRRRPPVHYTRARSPIARLAQPPGGSRSIRSIGCCQCCPLAASDVTIERSQTELT